MLAITKTFSHTTFATEEEKKNQAFGTSYHPLVKSIIITLPTNLSRYDWGRSLHQS